MYIEYIVIGFMLATTSQQIELFHIQLKMLYFTNEYSEEHNVERQNEK